jgi:DNA invertase Pin-like site-specific DNA recombinase
MIQMQNSLQQIIVQPYCRVSSERQEKYSLDAQIDIATRWCTQNNYHCLESIVETGSGESIDNRPGILRAINDARHQKYNIFFAVELSRIARDMEDAVNVIGIFRSFGIKVATPYKLFDYSNYQDSFLAHITSSMDELERQRLRERSERGRKKAKETGKYIGEQLPYGWKAKKIFPEDGSRPYTIIVQDEKEIKGLSQIIEFAEKGYSSREIANEMTKSGYPTKNGNEKWNQATISQLLKCTWLYGTATYFMKTSFKHDGKRIYVPQPEEKWITHNVSPMISKERYDAIQRMIKNRTLNSKHQTFHQYLFADLLTCGNCKAEATKRNQLHRSTRIGHRTDWYCHTLADGTVRKEPRYPYYVCVGRARHMRDWVCDLPQIRASILDDTLWGKTEKIISNPDIIYDSVVYSRKDTIEKNRKIEEQIGKKKVDISACEEEKKTAKRKFLTSKILTDDDLEEMIKEQDDKIKKLQNEIKKMQSFETADPKESVDKRALEEVCHELAKSIVKYDFKMKRKVVEALYEDIIIDKDWSVTLHGRIPLQKEGIDSLRQQLPKSTQHLPFASSRGCSSGIRGVRQEKARRDGPG